MITFQKLIDDVLYFIKKNGKQAITGLVLQQRLLDMIDKIKEVYNENRGRLNSQDGDIAELQGAYSEMDKRVSENGGSIANNKDRLDGIDAKIVLIDEKDAEQDANIQVNADNILKIDGDIGTINEKDLQQDGKIAENAQAIQANNQGIADLVGDVERIDAKDTEQDGRIESNEDDIKELYATTQIKDLDVEIRNVGGGRYISSDSADAIYNYAIKGGNVKIQINDKKYEFVTYRQRTAYFRYLAVMADKVMEEDIEIYGTDATFKTIEYEAVFDATPLLTSFTEQTPLAEDFIRDLDDAISEKKLIFVTGNGSIYLLTGTSKSGDVRTFTGIGRNTVYVLSYGTSKVVSLDAHTIGADIHIFNNENSVNILNLTTESTNEEIKEVFTDSTGEVIIPHANDIFYIYQNADVANNGSVESVVEDAYEIRLAVNMSNFENNLIHRVFYNISYDANVGVNSLRITNKVDNIINPSKLTEEAIDKMGAEIVNSVKTTPQELTPEQQEQVEKNIADGGYMRELIESNLDKEDGYYNRETGGWRLNELDLTTEQIEEIFFLGVINNNSYYKFEGLDILTNFPYSRNKRPYISTLGGWMSFDLSNCFIGSRVVTINIYREGVYISRMDNAFKACENLRKIITTLNIRNCKNLGDAFSGCKSLESIRIRMLNKDISFSDSTLLSYDSINYMVTNRAGENQITITLHAVPFALLNGTASDEQYQTSGHTKQEWTTLNSMAVVSKNIIFATE